MNSFSTKSKKKRNNWRDLLANGGNPLDGANPSDGTGSKFQEWHDRMDGKAKELKEEERVRHRSPSPPPEAKPNPRVYFDIGVGGSLQDPIPAPLGRLEMTLFADVVPKTAENFRQLCVGGSKSAYSGSGGINLCYLDNIFHRVIKGFMAQGGDITREDGTGGESIYGKTFQDENFLMQHTAPGTLSMANSGRHTNNSQFFITFVRTPHLDRKHVVFGRVDDTRSCMSVLRSIEDLAATKDGEPKVRVAITGCGELPPPTEKRGEYSVAVPLRSACTVSLASLVLVIYECARRICAERGTRRRSHSPKGGSRSCSRSRSPRRRGA